MTDKLIQEKASVKTRIAKLEDAIYDNNMPGIHKRLGTWKALKYLNTTVEYLRRDVEALRKELGR